MILPYLFLALTASNVDFDALWTEFHAAGDPLSREVVWVEIQRQGWSGDFDETVRKLRQRSYPEAVPTGILNEARTDLDGRRYRYTVLVPETYDPGKAYPLRVVLHGSTRRPAWRDDEAHWRWIDPFRHEEIFTVFPAAWEDAMWWSDRQIENLRAILDALRARYHIDPNRCYLTGLSDGGTGTFYHALRAPTPWAAFLPLIGHPWVLGNLEEEADGEIYAANLRGRALFAVNGESDHLYPAKALEPYLELFQRAGAQIQFKTKPGGHHVRWWPEESAAFADFRRKNPRDPFPDELTWETDDPVRNGRVSWLVIHKIGGESAPEVDPLNTVLFPDLDPPTRAEAFPRRRHSGRVELRRKGNVVHVTTRNVERFELLLGVDEFDLDEPIRVIVDGAEVRYWAKPSVETLIRWAIRDGDPSTLFGVSVVIEP